MCEVCRDVRRVSITKYDGVDAVKPSTMWVGCYVSVMETGVPNGERELSRWHEGLMECAAKCQSSAGKEDAEKGREGECALGDC